jgi:hypothetical protein
MVICKPEPKQGKKGAFKLRDHEQATKDLDELKDLMEAVDPCQWGLWTNSLELFFLKKVKGRFESEFEPMGDWPLADESQGTKDVHSHAKLRRAEGNLSGVEHFKKKGKLGSMDVVMTNPPFGSDIPVPKARQMQMAVHLAGENKTAASPSRRSSIQRTHRLELGTYVS